MPTGNRRDFLRVLAAGAGMSVLVPATRTLAQAQRSPILVTPLGDSLALIAGAGGNVVVAQGPDGLLLVNSGGREHTAALMKLIDAHAGGKRVRTVINTDWHPELTGGNEAFAKTGAE